MQFNALMPGEHDYQLGQPMPGQAQPAAPMAQPAKKRGPIMNALSSVFEFGAPEAFEQGRQKRITRDVGNALAGGDYAGAAKMRLQAADIDGATKINEYASGVDAEKRKAEARSTYQLFSSMQPLQINEMAMSDPAGFEQYTGMTSEEYLQTAQRLQQSGMTPEQFHQFVIEKAQAELEMEPAKEQGYGFQNIQGVGLVKTDPRTGTAELAYGLPEGAQADGADSVQSVQILDNGEIAYLTRSGRLERTGEYARNPYQITNIGDVPYAVDRTTGAASAISTPEAVGGSKATVATVVANEEARRTAQQDLPKVVATADRSISTLTQLRDHPALKFRYGLASVGGARPVVPGTPEAEAQALINQAGGQAFLQAFESLKGGGQITQIEGQRATDAITRLGNQNLSPEDAQAAINELIAIAEGAKKRAQAQSGGTYEAPGTSGQRLKYNPETGEFE